VQDVVNEVERWLITNYYTRFDAKEYLQEHVPHKIIQSYFSHTLIFGRSISDIDEIFRILVGITASYDSQCNSVLD
jgi:hypothetical protein